MDSDIFLNLKPNKLIVKCAIPAVITSVAGALYAVVDGMFVGKYIGESALASINIIMPIIMIIESLSNMIATGGSVNISMLLGKRDRQSASEIFTFSVGIIVLFSCIIGLPGFLFSRAFIEIIAPGANTQTIAMGAEYIKVYAVFLPLIPVYFALDNYLRVCGKQRLSMIVGVVSQLLNVVLDFVLIVLFKQGIRAVALASCISIAGGSVFMLLYFAGRKRDIFYTFKIISIKEFAHIIANGSSELLSNISMSVMSIIMNLFLIKYGGVTAVAAFSIVMYVDSIIGMINFGICDSMQPVISYCYGAKQIERMKIICKKVCIIIMGISVFSFLFMFISGPSVSRIFINSRDVDLLNVSKAAIRIFAFSYLLGWVDMCLSSFFTAIDKPVRSLVISFFGTLIFPIFFLIVLTPLFGLNGIWIMTTVSTIASALLAIILSRNML